MSLLRGLFTGRLPSLVLFDLDGTLIDSAPDITDAIDRMLETMGRSAAGLDKVRRWVGNGSPALVLRALEDRMIGAEQMADYQRSLSPQAHREWQTGCALFIDYYRKQCVKHTTLYPGVVEFLEHMQHQGVTMGCVTNKPSQLTSAIVAGLDLAGYFAIEIGGDSLVHKKPHPLPLLHAIGQLKAEVGQTLMIGDSINDVEAARRAGIKVVAVSYGYNHGGPVTETNPDLVVDSLAELI